MLRGRYGIDEMRYFCCLKLKAFILLSIGAISPICTRSNKQVCVNMFHIQEKFITFLTFSMTVILVTFAI